MTVNPTDDFTPPTTALEHAIATEQQLAAFRATLETPGPMRSFADLSRVTAAQQEAAATVIRSHNQASAASQADIAIQAINQLVTQHPVLFVETVQAMLDADDSGLRFNPLVFGTMGRFLTEVHPYPLPRKMPGTAVRAEYEPHDRAFKASGLMMLAHGDDKLLVHAAAHAQRRLPDLPTESPAMNMLAITGQHFMDWEDKFRAIKDSYAPVATLTRPWWLRPIFGG